MYRVDNVRVQYRYTECVFPSITIEPYGVTHVVGDNGCGKSTLLKILAGVLSPHAGYIYYKGIPITTKKLHVLHQEVTLLLQNNHLFDRSVRENLVYPFKVRNLSYTEDDILKALEYVGLRHNILEKYPYELSGGEKQRVAFAVRLVVKSEVLLLDEPVANVDSSTVIIIQNLLKEIANHTKIIIVAHNAPWAEQLATQTILL